MKNTKRNVLLLIGVAALVVALDQLTKWLVRENLALGEEFYPINALAPFFRFTYWKNTGAAFGIFQNASIPLLILAIIIVGVIIWTYFHMQEESLVFRICLAMMLGGAVGNIIDRITLGYVTDFIAVGRFPVFNVADSSVTVGVFLMLLVFFLEERKAKKKDADNTEPENGSKDD